MPIPNKIITVISPAAVAARFRGSKAEESGMKLPARLKELAAGAMLSSGRRTRHLVLARWFLHRRQQPLVLEPEQC